ncbi:oxidase [Elizabethkingia anophelis]|nr:oxidase [Elizabethkingia anophelis]
MKDILYTDRLVIENGDFVIADSDEQHQRDILKAYKGEFKASLEVGVGIDQMLNDDSIVPFLIEAKKMLEYDGMKINNISFEADDKLVIDGKYKEI